MAVEAESVRAAAFSRASDIWASVLSLLSRTFSYSASDVAARDSRAVADSDMESAVSETPFWMVFQSSSEIFAPVGSGLLIPLIVSAVLCAAVAALRMATADDDVTWAVVLSVSTSSL